MPCYLSNINLLSDSLLEYKKDFKLSGNLHVHKGITLIMEQMDLNGRCIDKTTKVTYVTQVTTPWFKIEGLWELTTVKVSNINYEL